MFRGIKELIFNPEKDTLKLEGTNREYPFDYIADILYDHMYDDEIEPTEENFEKYFDENVTDVLEMLNIDLEEESKHKEDVDKDKDDGYSFDEFDDSVSVKDDKVCCICGEKIGEYGNNPWPLKNDGECCDKCNAEKVIPARYKKMKSSVHDSASTVDALIASEEEAIALYTRAIEESGDTMESDLYKHILREEKEHLDELKKLRQRYSETEREYRE